MIERYFPKLLKWLLLSTAVVPMLYLQIFYSPFLTAKVLFFRTVVLLAVSAFLILVAEKKENFNFGVLKRKISWMPLILLGIFYLSAYFGLDFYNSFWSDFVRMEGLLTLTHVVVLFYLLILSFKREDWITYIKILAFSGGIAALYGIGQRIGLPFLAETGLDRAAGTLGNAAFLGSYSIFSLFLSYYIAKSDWGNRGFWYLVSAVSFLGIYFSGTRGAILALGTTLIVYLIYSLFQDASVKKRKYSGIILGAIVLIGLFGFLGRESLRESNINVVRRFANIGLSDSTTKSRLFVWNESFEYIKEKPVLGYGVENFPQLYDEIYDPVVVQEDWFDRSHNIYIDYLISTGIIGLVAYLLILVYILYRLFKTRNDDETNKILLFMFFAYMVQNFFVFDSISTLIAFYALLAFVVVKDLDIENKVIELNSITRYVLWVIAIIAVVLVYSVSYIPMKANFALSQGYKYQIIDEDRYLSEMNKGLALDTFAFKDYAYQNTQIFENQASSGAVSQQDLIRTYEFVTDLLKESIEKRPYDIRLYVYLGNLYEASIQYNIPVNTSPDEIEEYLWKAFEISPRRPEISYMLANLYTRRADTSTSQTQRLEYEAKAMQILIDYDELVPETASTKLIIANILFNTGNFEESGVYFDRAIKKYRWDTKDAERVIAYLIKTQRYAETIPYYEYLITNEPLNYNLKFDLSQAYYIAGEIDKSYDLLQTISDNSPETLNISPEFVNQVYTDISNRN